MSYIQLPYGLVRKDKKIKLNLPKNYPASEYIARLPYIDNSKDPKFQNDAIDIINNRADIRKFLLDTSDYGKNLQEGINSVVAHGHFNNVTLRHLLDNKNKGVFKSPNPLSVTFKDANKFDVQNPVIGNIISQVSASQLTDNQVQKLLGEGEDQKIRARLDLLRRNNLRDDNDSDNNDEDDGSGGGCGSTARGRRISKKRPPTTPV